MNNLLSIVIPSRNEVYLNKTVDDILLKAKGDVEIFVVLDGYWPAQVPVNDKRVVIIHRGISRGMRDAINSGVSLAKGDYIMKTDAHCMFSEGFDVALIKDCEDDWVVVPRRKRLDAENWQVQDVKKPDVDYMYLSYPYAKDKNGKEIGLHGVNWDTLNVKRSLKKQPITDLMSAQGSCWFMKKDYFHKLELMDENHYGAFWSEFQEIGLKAWLSGGRVVCNKNAWYAHLHKKTRGYSLDTSSCDAEKYVMKWMKMGEAWDKQTLPIEFLIDKFKPVPGWPE
jgi:glycosyltransferase involved in cell wall biosynthesis